MVNILLVTNILNVEVYDDWRKPIIDYLSGLDEQPSRSIRLKSINDTMYAEKLYKKGSDGILLECLSKFEGMKAIAQVHEGLCGAHLSGIKMRWLLSKAWCVLANNFKRLH